jgi:flagellar motility protein MotE (MotC chaperone)
MTDLEQLRAMAQELAAQRNLMGDRALNLARELAEKNERIAELEKENAELKKGAPRVVKSS